MIDDDVRDQLVVRSADEWGTSADGRFINLNPRLA